MMLGYVHNTTKIWRIWDFNSGRTGRAVEFSSVVFQEEENAHTEEQTEAVEFTDNADELHEGMNENSPSRQENSKSNHFIVGTANWLRAAGRYVTYTCRLQRIGSMSCWADAC
jgi:hypothetical protein